MTTKPTPQEFDPFNCPKCGSHDYGLYAAGMLPCPHCQAEELAAVKLALGEAREALGNSPCGVLLLQGASQMDAIVNKNCEPCNCWRRALGGEGE